MLLTLVRSTAGAKLTTEGDSRRGPIPLWYSGLYQPEPGWYESPLDAPLPAGATQGGEWIPSQVLCSRGCRGLSWEAFCHYPSDEGGWGRPAAAWHQQKRYMGVRVGKARSLAALAGTAKPSCCESLGK